MHPGLMLQTNKLGWEKGINVMAVCCFPSFTVDCQISSLKDCRSRYTDKSTQIFHKMRKKITKSYYVRRERGRGNKVLHCTVTHSIEYHYKIYTSKCEMQSQSYKHYLKIYIAKWIFRKNRNKMQSKTAIEHSIFKK